MRPVLAGLLAVLLLMAAAPAHAQVDSREAILLQNQMLELKRDIQQLREQIASGGSGGSSSLGSARSSSGSSSANGDLTAALLDRVTRLEDAVRSLRGHIDEVDNARQRQGDDLSKQIADLNFKVDNGAGAAPTNPPRTPPAAATSPSGTLPPATLPPGGPPAGGIRRTPELALQEGNAALARRDYASAETAAREVLNTPKSPRAIDAQFLLAEALVGKRDYAAAAVAFDDSYNRSRTGPHAQDSLLGLANSLSTLGEKRAACATLDKLKTEFPTPRPELRQPIVQARQQAACH